MISHPEAGLGLFGSITIEERRGCKVLLCLSGLPNPEQAAVSDEDAREGRHVSDYLSVLKVGKWAIREWNGQRWNWVKDVDSSNTILCHTVYQSCKVPSERLYAGCWKVDQITGKQRAVFAWSHWLNILIVLEFLALKRYETLISAKRC